MVINISPSYIVFRKLYLLFKLTFWPKIQPACHNDANRIKLGRNLKMTDKHAAV